MCRDQTNCYGWTMNIGEVEKIVNEKSVKVNNKSEWKWGFLFFFLHGLNLVEILFAFAHQNSTFQLILFLWYSTTTNVHCTMLFWVCVFPRWNNLAYLGYIFQHKIQGHQKSNCIDAACILFVSICSVQAICVCAFFIYFKISSQKYYNQQYFQQLICIFCVMLV